MAEPPEPERPPIEVEVEPTLTQRFALWVERGRAARRRVDAARADHASVGFAFEYVERDSSIGGGLLAGALAYRLFVVLLPAALLFVSGLGLYAEAADTSTRKVAEETGLTGLVASQVASSSNSDARWAIFLLMIPTLLYAIAKLYRSIAIVNSIAWRGTGRGARMTPRGFGIFIAAMIFHVLAVGAVGWIRHRDQFGGLAALVVYLVLVGGAWLVVSTQLPHGDVGWTALLPGSLLFGVGLLFINAFNVYFTTRMVDNQADTYGALGIAAALLFSLVLVGRLIVASAVLNALVARHRAAQS